MRTRSQINRWIEQSELERIDRRERALDRKWNEKRLWFLTCPACEHDGAVETTLKKLKSANIRCSACGAYLWRNSL